jgi:hypothetical protein
MPKILTIVSGTVVLVDIARTFTELLTAGTNTLSNLTFTPDFSYNVRLSVNGKGESTLTNSFSVSGKVLTWSSVNAGYDIDSTYEIVATYTTLE